jgi:hypothetical protein
MGVEKRVKHPEHHVTVKHFPNVNIEELAQELAVFSQGYAGDISQTEFLFDGFGQIKRPEGRYIYFSPNDESAPEAHELKTRLNPEGSELHLSIGGPDPFGGPKPKQHELKDAFRAKGRLVFVGNDGMQFRKFVWDKNAGNFISLDQPAKPAESKPVAPMAPQPVHTIAIFPKIQADTATAVYLLKNFGEKQFPGISQAKIIFWTAPLGYPASS